MAIELATVTTPAVPARTIGEAIGTFTLAPKKAMEIAHWSPGKVIDLDAAPPAGKSWFVTVHVHVVETDA